MLDHGSADANDTIFAVGLSHSEKARRCVSVCVSTHGPKPFPNVSLRSPRVPALTDVSAGKNEQGPTATLAFWQCGLCNLQNLMDGRGTESLSLRDLAVVCHREMTPLKVRAQGVPDVGCDLQVRTLLFGAPAVDGVVDRDVVFERPIVPWSKFTVSIAPATTRTAVVSLTSVRFIVFSANVRYRLESQRSDRIVRHACGHRAGADSSHASLSRNAHRSCATPSPNAP